jgi:type III pantothenate kinase
MAVIGTIDYGNTFSKVAIFNKGNILKFLPRVPSVEIVALLKDFELEHVMLCSVSKEPTQILQELAAITCPIYVLDTSQTLPININYDTPHTLGPDRIAAAAGAAKLFPNQNCLIVDMGTCIKYDLLDHEACFQGGIISPGLQMRFKAMHTFTKKLPLITETEPWPKLIGKSTKTAMQSGVMNAILAETNGIIEMYQGQLTNIKIILSGGDAHLFETKLKYTNFVVKELVNIGLHSILEHQINKSKF